MGAKFKRIAGKKKGEIKSKIDSSLQRDNYAVANT